ncbi:MAG: alpha/beta hydrolase [Planctomycetes bacterium]|nr:alpha/beta hydrolase [Planctomycetota bacterium]
MLRASVTLSILLLATAAANAAELETFDLWPGKAPGETGDLPSESTLPDQGPKKVVRLTNVTEPTLTIFPAPEDRRTGTAVLVCPGGGYNILAWDLEGEEVARWLNSIGVTAALLKYRVPRRKDRAKHEAPLQDAQRALSLLRSRAEEWHIDPKRIGILGFSAGGHLSVATSTNFDRRQYESLDEHDRASCRPDFAVLIYPAYLVEEGQTDKLAPEIRVSAETPPMFFAHAGDDRIGPENSIALYLALKQAGVPAELHIYECGGHGFGLRDSEHPCSQWPARCEAWLRGRGLLPE